MNEEKHPTFPDKYHLSRKESVYLYWGTGVQCGEI